jgi:hypothetical protein
MKVTLAVAAAFLTSAAFLPAQNVILYEDFSTAVPPAGWSQVKINPLAVGWYRSLDGRAWHEDELGPGTVDDYLIAPMLDLTAFTGVYAHFYTELFWADYLANHPNSLGNGETDLVVRVNGGAWVEVWTESRTLNGNAWQTADMSAVAGQNNVEFAFRYYGDFAHEQWLDLVQVDDDPANPTIPPPSQFTVNLPAQFLPLTQTLTTDDFEAYAGVLPGHMAVTSVDALTGLPSPDGWCTIAGGTIASHSGVRSLEMGLNPAASGGFYVNNSLVLGLDGTSQASLGLRFWSRNLGDEDDVFDGAWISQDGGSWFHVVESYDTSFLWAQTSVDLAAYSDITRGPFYLMFAQTDDFAFNGADGIDVDDLSFLSSGPAGPSLTKTGSCPGPLTLDLSDCTPGGSVAMLTGAAGSTTQTNPSLPCLGLTVNLASPTLVGILTANAAGAASASFNSSVTMCGATVQGVNLATCQLTNTVTL